MNPPRGWVDLSDPRVAEHLRQIAQGADRMARALAAGEAAARRHAEDLAALAAALEERPAPAPVVVVVVLAPSDVDLDDADDTPALH